MLFVDNTCKALALEEEAKGWQSNMQALQDQLTATKADVSDECHPMIEMLTEALNDTAEKYRETVKTPKYMPTL